MSRPRGRPPKGASLPDIETERALLDLWESALAKGGIAVSSTKPNRLAQLLYRARRECGHLSYSGLKVVELTDKVLICPR